MHVELDDKIKLLELLPVLFDWDEVDGVGIDFTDLNKDKTLKYNICLCKHFDCNTYSFPISDTFHTRKLPSKEQQANVLLLLFHEILVTGAIISRNSVNCDPAAKSNIRILFSSPAAAKYFPSGLNDIACMGNLQSVKTRNNFPDVTHHNLTVKSVEPVAM